MYEELVKRLRECTAEQNGEKTLWHQAADAIEELSRGTENGLQCAARIVAGSDWMLQPEPLKEEA